MKLIRDKIPDRIRAEGRERDVRPCHNDAEFRTLLIKKLSEEADEVYLAENREQILAELGDLTEVIAHVMAAFDISETDLQNARSAKRVKNGGFDGRWVLLP